MMRINAPKFVDDPSPTHIKALLLAKFDTEEKRNNGLRIESYTASEGSPISRHELLYDSEYFYVVDYMDEGKDFEYRRQVFADGRFPNYPYIMWKLAE